MKLFNTQLNINEDNIRSMIAKQNKFTKKYENHLEHNYIKESFDLLNNTPVSKFIALQFQK